MIAEMLKTARALMDETAELESSFLVLFRLSGAVRDNADDGTLQPHEVSHLFEPILVNVNCVVNLLVGDEIPTG